MTSTLTFVYNLPVVIDVSFSDVEKKCETKEQAVRVWNALKERMGKDAIVGESASGYGPGGSSELDEILDDAQEFVDETIAEAIDEDEKGWEAGCECGYAHPCDACGGGEEDE